MYFLKAVRSRQIIEKAFAASASGRLPDSDSFDVLKPKFSGETGTAQAGFQTLENPLFETDFGKSPGCRCVT
jgi:hypothetical protein